MRKGTIYQREEVEDTIRQLIEKGVSKIKYLYIVNRTSPICGSPLCPRAVLLKKN